MAEDRTGRVDGMREKDLLHILTAANAFGVIILVRHTNELSLPYIAVPGYYPKPVFVKAKTADFSPPGTQYSVGGLVVHPGIQRECFAAEKRPKAEPEWEHTLELLDPKLLGLRPNPSDKASLATWGRDRPVQAEGFRNWMWRVDIDPESKHFGCLQLRCDDSEPRFNPVLPGYKKAVPWSYVHGDYDLKDVIQIGREAENVVNCEYRGSRVVDFTSQLVGLDYDKIKRFINDAIGSPMCQHGAEAQFGKGGKEDVITVAYSDWTMEVLANVTEVDNWYTNLARKTRLKEEWEGGDPPKSELFDPKGRMFKPGKHPFLS